MDGGGVCKAAAMEPLILPDQLTARLDDPTLRIVDCRFVLGRPDEGRRLYLAAHLPGAVFLSLDEDLADPVGDGSRGRHPLPSLERFTTAARTAGISGDTTVVAYDQGGAGGAARLWWLLRHFGHDQVAVLDGGFGAWTGATETGETEVVAGDFNAQPPADDVVDLDDVAARLRRPDRLLVDARAPERYRGEVEPIDRVAGHLPGAVNSPYTGDLDPGLLTDQREVVVYCGSGVTACELLLRLAAGGRDDVKLFAGSYSEWVNNNLPVERA